MQHLKWRRTVFGEIGGQPATLADDWTLADGGRSLARIYRLIHGPLEGRWAWFVQVTAEGLPGDGGTGVEETGEAAFAACEQRLPERYKASMQESGVPGS